MLSSAPVLAQAERAYSIPGNRITSIDDLSASDRSLVIHLLRPVIADRPEFRYLQGEGGDTILTADFPGLAWNLPAKIIRLNSSEMGLRSGVVTGIKEVRIGQFSQSPPVLRISFQARDPHTLKAVAIAAGPGLLKISFAPAPKTKAQPVEETASSAAAPVAAGDVKTAKMPPLAPSIGKRDVVASSETAPLVSSRTARQTPAAPPVAAADATAIVSSKSARQAPMAVAPSEIGSSVGVRPSKQTAPIATAGAAPVATASSARQAFRDQARVDSGSTNASSSTSGVASSGRLKRPASFDSALAQTVSRTGAAGPGTMSGAPLLDSDKAKSGFGGKSSGTAGGIDGTADAETEEPAPTISLVPCDNMGSGVTMEVFRLEMPFGHPLTFKSFRLHNPERYVIDIPNCPTMANAEIPDLTASSLVSSMRVGVPDSETGAGRLVLQLADKDINVLDKFSPGSSYLSITLGRGLIMNGDTQAVAAGTGAVERFNSADIAPGPIVVPRAPDETVIVLDAGHGGSDCGAMRADIQEKDLTLGIINKLKRVLESKGARIVMTRSDDTFVSLEDRVKITNQVNPNLFLSVHINSLEGTSNISGIETYFQTDLSRPLAERVHASLVAGLGAPDRNIRKARFYVINHTPVPAILAEVGYITNRTERDRLNSSDYQEKVASALARGVMLYLQDTGAASGQLAHSARSQNRNPQ